MKCHWLKCIYSLIRQVWSSIFFNLITIFSWNELTLSELHITGCGTWSSSFTNWPQLVKVQLRFGFSLIMEEVGKKFKIFLTSWISKRILSKPLFSAAAGDWHVISSWRIFFEDGALDYLHFKTLCPLRLWIVWKCKKY